MEDLGLRIVGLDSEPTAPYTHWSALQAVVTATDHVLRRLDKVEAFRDSRWVGVLLTEVGDDDKRDVKFCIDTDREEVLNKMFRAKTLNPAFVITVLLDRERGVIDTYNHKEQKE